MDHDETREQLELAAVEPGGLDRLMAGDTPTAQSVAGHLAGCESCTSELGRLRRSSGIIRADLHEMPPADLKARTLAAIRSEGVQRPLVAASAGVAVMPLGEGADGASATPTAIAGASPRRTRTWTTLAMVATIAAAVVLSVVTTSLIVGRRVDDQLAQQALTIDALEHVTTTTMAVAAQPDAEHVQLAGVSDPALDGSLVYSAGTTDLVVVATGLTEPASGYEYRCWVEVNGQRERIGRMFFGGDLAYWAGEASAIAGASGPTTFGVSLVDVSAPTLDAQPVLVGSD
ncbi:MAG: anti-sigma factor family protein [Chloroflexota bacterium]